MEDDGVAGQEFSYFFQSFIVQIGVAFVFVGAVAGADGNGQGVAAGAFYKFRSLVGVCEDGIFGIDADHIFHAGQTAQFCFYDYAFVMGIFYDLLCDFDVFFKGMLGAVIHDRGESAVNAGFADFIGGTVIQVKGSGDFRIILQRNFYKAYDVFLPCIVAGAFGGLKNDRRFFFLGSFHNALDDFHIVHIESTDGIMTFIGFLKHFSSSYKRHSDDLPFKLIHMN